MNNASNYHQLTRTFQRLSRFSHLSAIAGWDMFAMMPPGGSAARSEALAELGVLQHQILTDKKVGDLVKEASAKLGENIVIRQFKRIELGVTE